MCDLEVLCEVAILKLFEFLLVGFGLGAVNGDDALSILYTPFEVLDLVLVVVLHVVGLDLSLDFAVALHSELSALNVESHGIDFLLHGALTKIDLRGEAVVDGPLDEALEVREVVDLILLIDSEGLAKSIKLLEGVFDNLQIDGGGLCLGHLRDELGSVLEEKLDVSGSRSWLVAEESDEDLEGLAERLWAVVLQDMVDHLNGLWADHSLVGSAVVDVHGGGDALGLVVLHLTLLLEDSDAQVLNLLLLVSAGLEHGLHIGSPVVVLFLDFFERLLDLTGRGLRVLPVVGLESNGLVHLRLSLVAFALNESEQLGLAFTLDLRSDTFGDTKANQLTKRCR